MFLQSFPRWSGYAALVRQEPTLPDNDAESSRVELGDRCMNTIALLSIANVTLFAMTLIMLFASSIPIVDRRLNAALRVTSTYSPVFDMIDLEPSVKTINGSLHAGGNLSIARQFPNPAADAIWEEDIELIRPIPVTREQIIKMGKNPDTAAKFEHDVWGLGDNAYVAALDIFHNLQCLNTKQRLRQAAYAGYYNQSIADARASDSHYEIHLNHCVDILFQNIACRHWTEDLEYPFPDFSINKHCIDFPKLNDWHKSTPIDMKKYVDVMKKPIGVKEEPAERLRRKR